MTQNLEERILKLRKSARSSGLKAVKANLFTASEGLHLCPPFPNLKSVLHV